MSERQHFIDAILSSMSIEEMIGQLISTAAGEGPATGANAGPGSHQISKKIENGEIGFILGPKKLETTRAFQDAAMDRRKGHRPIPLAFAEDVIHGHKTGFPINLALAGMFDAKRLEQLVRIWAIESTAIGIDIAFAPVADKSNPHHGRIAETSGEPVLLRSVMSAAQVRGFQTDDLARNDAMASIGKHPYGYQEPKIDYSGARIPAEEFNNDHRVPFDEMRKAGVRGLMVSFNTLNGIPMHAHGEAMADLRDNNADYETVIFADFAGIEQLEAHGLGTAEACTVRGLMSGVDVDLMSNNFLKYLPHLAQAGYQFEDAGLNYSAQQIRDRIKEACGRVLGLKYDLGLFKDPYLRINQDRAVNNVMTPEHLNLARQAAADTCILFKNQLGHNNQTPLPLQSGQKIALIGPLAAGDEARANMTGTWAVATDAEKCVTPMEGLQEVLGPQAVIYYAKGANIVNDPDLAARLNVHNQHYPCVKIEGCAPEDLKLHMTIEEKEALAQKISKKLIRQAINAARKADVIIACVGEAKEHSGESSSRMDIDLPGTQLDLLKALKELSIKENKPLIVVTFSGRPLAEPWIKRNADAHLHAWFGGTQAGLGLADILTGQSNPLAKSPVTWPKHSYQEISYNDLPGGRPQKSESTRVAGDNELDEDGDPAFTKFECGALDLPTIHKPLYYLGEGQSYTTYEYAAPQVNLKHLRGDDDAVEITVSVTNVGDHDGRETVFLFAHDPVSSRSQPSKNLIRFQQIELKGHARDEAGNIIQSGETKDITFRVNVKDLEFSVAKEMFDKTKIWEPGEFIFMTGPSANPKDLQSVSVDWRKAPKNNQETTVSNAYKTQFTKTEKLSDEELMDKVQRASIRYFTDKAHSSGMPFERTDPEAYGGAPLIPMGGTGFAIQNILVGAHRGWVSPEAALAQIERMVDFLEQVPKYHGAFSHFYHAETKQTFELFPKDNGGDILETALLMTGLLCAREYFSGNDESSTRLRSRIDALWHAVEWDWYTNNEDVLYWHWSEEHDFGNKHEITGYNEGLGLYTLAAASPTHPISPSVYHNGWSKSQDCFKGGEREHYGIKLPLGPAHLKGGPLFFELFNFMGLDPKGLSDAHANYAEQARAHVLIDRAYCEDNPRRFQDYSHKLFGLTECDTPDGYRACSPGNDDGTIAPYASIASMQFTPEESMAALI
jgi:beta-glucosidase